MSVKVKAAQPQASHVYKSPTSWHVLQAGGARGLYLRRVASRFATPYPPALVSSPSTWFATMICALTSRSPAHVSAKLAPARST